MHVHKLTCEKCLSWYLTFRVTVLYCSVLLHIQEEPLLYCVWSRSIYSIFICAEFPLVLRTALTDVLPSLHSTVPVAQSICLNKLKALPAWLVQRSLCIDILNEVYASVARLFNENES